MSWTIDHRFRIAGNRAIVSFIKRHANLSAHDETATCLTESARGLPGVNWYCPDVQSYAYFILHSRDNRIFGIAFGQRALAYRVPKGRIAEAVAEGGTPCPDIGEGWVLFDPWKPDGPGSLRRWCKIAHDHVVAGGTDHCSE